MTTSTLLALLFVAAAGLLLLRLVGRTVALLLRLALLALLVAGLAMAVGLRGGALPPLPGPAGSGSGHTPSGPGR